MLNEEDPPGRERRQQPSGSSEVGSERIFWCGNPSQAGFACRMMAAINPPLKEGLRRWHGICFGREMRRDSTPSEDTR